MCILCTQKNSSVKAVVKNIFLQGVSKSLGDESNTLKKLGNVHRNKCHLDDLAHDETVRAILYEM